MNVSTRHKTIAAKAKMAVVCTMVRPKNSEKLIFRPRRPFMPRF